jgi:hypothetical protein
MRQNATHYAAKRNALCGKMQHNLPQNTTPFCGKMQGCFAAKRQAVSGVCQTA